MKEHKVGEKNKKSKKKRSMKNKSCKSRIPDIYPFISVVRLRSTERGDVLFTGKSPFQINIWGLVAQNLREKN